MKLLNLNEMFYGKLFRIPDYQRGYAWQLDQLNDFWEDLINLSSNATHYMGVLTLQEQKGYRSSDINWLLEDHSYSLYDVIDGQQRLTTIVLLINSVLNFLRGLNNEKPDTDIFLTESLSVNCIKEKFLYISKPKVETRSYKFGYTEDDPSFRFLRHKIFGEVGAGELQETFYTLNLQNANVFFKDQLTEIFNRKGLDGIKEIYNIVSKRLNFNEYIVADAQNIFVTFETMNNRGKSLSDLELLKNRLIYLTSILQASNDDLIDLRKSINETWKEIYYQLGKNKEHPLNDDDFLKAHWTMFFKYSRRLGNDYINYLLKNYFSLKRVLKKTAVSSNISQVIETRDQPEYDMEYECIEEPEGCLTVLQMRNYILSIKDSALHWFNTFFPLTSNIPYKEIKDILERLNRIGFAYFRPLAMSILKNLKEDNWRESTNTLIKIERFIFIVFKLSQTRSTYRDTEFYNYSRDYDNGSISLSKIQEALDERMKFLFNSDGKLESKYFLGFLTRKFSTTYDGYYGWSALKYFLYEYEQSLKESSRQTKVSWDDLLKTKNDLLSVEHILPQTPNEKWKEAFNNVKEEDFYLCSGSIGNLLLLSSSINSSLQNDSFNEKKEPKYDENNKKLRNGYKDGSHSEIEVSIEKDWKYEQIKNRGNKLLEFMEKHWDFEFDSKEGLLFLPNLNPEHL